MRIKLKILTWLAARPRFSNSILFSIFLFYIGYACFCFCSLEDVKHWKQYTVSLAFGKTDKFKQKYTIHCGDTLIRKQEDAHLRLVRHREYSSFAMRRRRTHKLKSKKISLAVYTRLNFNTYVNVNKNAVRCGDLRTFACVGLRKLAMNSAG